MKEVRDKVAEVRRVLENGLQQYHDDALYNNEDNINMNSITFEKELQWVYLLECKLTVCVMVGVWKT